MIKTCLSCGYGADDKNIDVNHADVSPLTRLVFMYHSISSWIHQRQRKYIYNAFGISTILRGDDVQRKSICLMWSGRSSPRLKTTWSELVAYALPESHCIRAKIGTIAIRCDDAWYDNHT